VTGGRQPAPPPLPPRRAPEAEDGGPPVSYEEAWARRGGHRWWLPAPDLVLPPGARHDAQVDEPEAVARVILALTNPRPSDG
jgi:hypothetical protein